jgi:hypothetical protein
MRVCNELRASDQLVAEKEFSCRKSFVTEFAVGDRQFSGREFTEEYSAVNLRLFKWK